MIRRFRAAQQRRRAAAVAAEMAVPVAITIADAELRLVDIPLREMVELVRM